MKITPEGQLNEAEEQTSNLEKKAVENTQSEQQNEKRILKNEDSLRVQWDNLKCNNIHIIRVPE